MSVSCKVIEDLLPLYHDGVCSAESRALVTMTEMDDQGNVVSTYVLDEEHFVWSDENHHYGVIVPSWPGDFGDVVIARDVTDPDTVVKYGIEMDICRDGRGGYEYFPLRDWMV